MIALEITVSTNKRSARFGTSKFETSLECTNRMADFGEIVGIAVNAVRNHVSTYKSKRDVLEFFEAFKAQLDPDFFDGFVRECSATKQDAEESLEDETTSVLATESV